MNLRFIQILLIILIPFSMLLESHSIYDLRINHIAKPFAIDITDNNFSFKTEEDGPFIASLLKKDEVIQIKEINLTDSHSFTFDSDLEYGTQYKYVIQSKTTKSTSELEFETAIKLSVDSFIKPKNDKLFSPIFKKDFNSEKQIKKGRLYITGLGLYQAYINNNRVGNYYLTPGFNDYDAYLRYQGYDITSLLKENNIIEVHMGDGWYKGRYGISHGYPSKNDEIWGSEYKLCAKIIIEFNDGTKQEISTDNSWKVKSSKEIRNSIYDGEEIDFTLSEGQEEEVVISSESYNLIPDFGAPMVEKETLVPVLYTSPKGEKILDFKQNMVGFVRYKGNLERNQLLNLTFGEVLQNKNFYNGNYRSATKGLQFKEMEKKEYLNQNTHFLDLDML